MEQSRSKVRMKKSFDEIEGNCTYCLKPSMTLREVYLRCGLSNWNTWIDKICPDCRKFLHGNFLYRNATCWRR